MAEPLNNLATRRIILFLAMVLSALILFIFFYLETGVEEEIIHRQPEKEFVQERILTKQLHKDLIPKSPARLPPALQGALDPSLQVL